MTLPKPLSFSYFFFFANKKTRLRGIQSPAQGHPAIHVGARDTGVCDSRLTPLPGPSCILLNSQRREAGLLCPRPGLVQSSKKFLLQLLAEHLPISSKPPPPPRPRNPQGASRVPGTGSRRCLSPKLSSAPSELRSSLEGREDSSPSFPGGWQSSGCCCSSSSLLPG